MKTFKELKVWQRSLSLTLEIYRITKNFPHEETYALTDQIRRSAVAIPSNIAEGFCRQHKKEYIQFLTIAFSSGGELETQLLIANKLGYLSNREFNRTNSILTEVMKMLNVLIKKLKLVPSR